MFAVRCEENRISVDAASKKDEESVMDRPKQKRELSIRESNPGLPRLTRFYS
jgi:hypothetical protein